MKVRRSRAYYLVAVTWFGTAAAMFAASSGNGSLYAAFGWMYLAGWVVIAALWWREYLSFMAYLEREHPQLHEAYVGSNWFWNLSHWRLLVFSFRSEGNSDAVLREQKRAYVALSIIPLVAVAAFITAQSFWR